MYGSGLHGVQRIPQLANGRRRRSSCDRGTGGVDLQARTALSSRVGGDLLRLAISPLLHSFPLPLPLWIAAQQEENSKRASRQGAAADLDLGAIPQGAAAEQGRSVGGGLYRGRLGFPGARASGGDVTRGVRSGYLRMPAQQEVAAMGAGASSRRPPPCPTAASRDKAERGEKVGERRG
jgi:hypothetical protein